MEREYIKVFSQSIEKNSSTVFIDQHIPDMYTHNFTYYKSIDGLKEVILNELQDEKFKEAGFLRIETPFQINEEFVSHLPIKPNISMYDIMAVKTEIHNELDEVNCSLFCLDNEQVLTDAIKVDVDANKKDMGLDFAQRRAMRKSEVYKDRGNPVQLFVCYKDDQPLGKIEFFPFENIVKLEDFDILEKYQRKGYGTSMLKRLLKIAHEKGIEIAYLIADCDDTAKEMYKKCGFKHVGEKTELLFFYSDKEE